MNFSTKAQNIKFGHVSVKEFDTTQYNVDRSTGAIIISDVGSSSYKIERGLCLLYKHECRALITNKNSFDLGEIEIPLYVNGNTEETVENVKASTYNLVDGKIVETKLDNQGVYSDYYNKHFRIKKIILPAIKEGSIIEYSYTVKSVFFLNLQSWSFQGAHPVIWSEYHAAVPQYFRTIILTHGYLPFFINTQSQYLDASLDVNVADLHWAMANIPPLKEENFTSSIGNHISKIEFHLADGRYQSPSMDDVSANWAKASNNLLKDEDFGVDLKKNNNWLDDKMKIITNGATSSLEKAKKIYYYVKNNFTSAKEFGIWLNKPIKDVFKDKNGNIADINLLLIAMLKHEDIEANPVILSTRKHGVIQEKYPLLNKFNYVVCKINVDGYDYFLDATQQFLGFGHLQASAYNGPAKVILQDPISVYFNADTLFERSRTNIMLYNDDKIAGKWEGNCEYNPGYIESTEIRKKIASDGKKEFENGLKMIDFSTSNITIEDSNDLEKPLTINYDLESKTSETENPDIIYLNPVLKNRYLTNPFSATERVYPVEMPDKMDEIYSFYLDIPNGYEVDELPQSTRVDLDNAEGFFEYVITKSESSINMRLRINLSKADFPTKEYAALRNFFGLIVKKEAEDIVFKKKK